MKKVVFIVAPENFRDEEYAVPKKILTGAGITVVTASAVKATLRGRFGLETESTVTIGAMAPEEFAETFDAVVFVGGGGANIYFENETALNIARAFCLRGKITAAICIAPVILANAGILKGKKAAVFPDGIETLKKAGAIYENKAVAVDGNIITGRDYLSAEEFGNTLLEYLQK